jgi:hypothetical protein
MLREWPVLKLFSLLLGLLPVARVTLQSKLPPDHIVRRLKEYGVFREQFFRALVAAPNRELVGSYKEDRFITTWKCGYLNSYQPFVRGNIRSADSGSQIELTFTSPVGYIIPVILLFVTHQMLIANIESALMFQWLTIGAALHAGGIGLFFLEKRKMEQYIKSIVN